MEVFYIILSIILGWLFGILSPGIINRISNCYEKDKLQRVIIGELKDLKKRLAYVPFLINSRYGNIDKELFIWIKEQTAGSEGDFAKINIKNDKELTEFLDHLNSSRKKDEPAFHFKKMITSVIDSSLMNIGILDNEFLTELLDIKFQINAFNEEIQNVNEYLKMTFDSNITDTNHQIIKKEIDNKNFIISEKAIDIVEKINRLI